MKIIASFMVVIITNANLELANATLQRPCKEHTLKVAHVFNCPKS